LTSSNVRTGLDDRFVVAIFRMGLFFAFVVFRADLADESFEQIFHLTSRPFRRIRRTRSRASTYRD